MARYLVRPSVIRLFALVIICAGLAVAGCAGVPAGTPGPAVEEAQEPEAPRQAWNPAVIVEPGGRIFVTYLGGLGGSRYDLFFNRSLDGGATWLPKPVELFAPTPGTSIGFHQITSDGAGLVRASWLIERQEAGFLKPNELHSRVSVDLGMSWSETLAWPFKDNSNYPKTVSGSNGNLHLLWMDRSTPRFVPRFISTIGGGTAWAASPVTLPGMKKAAGAQKQDSPSRDAAWPRLASTGMGDLYAVWQETSPDLDTDILFNLSRDDGATWLPVSPRLNTPPSAGVHTSREPVITLDGVGGVYVVWEDFRHNTSDLYFNRSLDGGTTWLEQDVWLTAVRPSLAAATRPVLRADRTGHLYLLWTDLREAGHSFYFTHSLDRGDTWAPATRLDRHGEGAITWAPRLVSDNTGHVYTAWWEGSKPTEGTIRFRHSSDYGATWEEEQVLDTGLGKEGPRFPILEVDKNGVVYLMWSSDRSGNYRLYLNQSTDYGRTWLREPRKLTGRPTGSPQGS